MIHRIVALAAVYVVSLIGIAASLYANPSYWAQDYHTSALTGAVWVNKLIHGHPDHIYDALGVHLHVFIAFVAKLRLVCSLTDSEKGTFERF
ncbi:hypothetical protein DXG01_016694 [Tephrocybe rancida]|nr:hypothetical protein DXG01_016694 [Tephrocybe rancida]